MGTIKNYRQSLERSILFIHNNYPESPTYEAPNGKGLVCEWVESVTQWIHDELGASSIMMHTPRLVEGNHSHWEYQWESHWEWMIVLNVGVNKHPKFGYCISKTRAHIEFIGALCEVLATYNLQQCGE